MITRKRAKPWKFNDINSKWELTMKISTVGWKKSKHTVCSIKSELVLKSLPNTSVLQPVSLQIPPISLFSFFLTDSSYNPPNQGYFRYGTSGHKNLILDRNRPFPQRKHTCSLDFATFSSPVRSFRSWYSCFISFCKSRSNRCRWHSTLAAAPYINQIISQNHKI